MASVDEVIERLRSMSRKPRQSGQGWSALCPAHDDHKASLSINRGRNGAPLLYCHSGCRYEDIMAALGFEKGKSCSSKQIVSVYDYTDEQGTVLYQAVRYLPKSFKLRRPDGNGAWSWSLQGVRRVLYRLPELREAILQGRRIFVCEGERDCESLKALGLVATTNVSGAGKWRPEFSGSLRGARVVIVPDADKPGRRHAQQVAEALRGITAETKILELPNLPPKGDVSDWLASGGTAVELERLANEASVWQEEGIGDGEKRLGFLQVHEREVSDLVNVCFQSRTASLAYRLFMHLLAGVPKREGWYNHTHRVKVKVGQVLTTLSRLSKELRADRSAVSRILKRLASKGELRLTVTRDYTLITVVKLWNYVHRSSNTDASQNRTPTEFEEGP